MEKYWAVGWSAVLAPISVALVYGAAAFIDAADGWRLMLGMAGLAIGYGAGLTVTLAFLVPIAIVRPQTAYYTYGVVATVAALLLFVAFSLFTGSFGPIRDWIWIPFAGGLLGCVFAWIYRRKQLNYKVTWHGDNSSI